VVLEADEIRNEMSRNYFFRSMRNFFSHARNLRWGKICEPGEGIAKKPPRASYAMRIAIKDEVKPVVEGEGAAGRT